MREVAENLLHYRAIRSADAEVARTKKPLKVVKQVLVVSEEELRELEQCPAFLRGVERARALREEICDDEGASSHA